jgi:hypothetical protein
MMAVVVVVTWQAGDVARWPKHGETMSLGPFFFVPGFLIVSKSNKKM